jgi:hypothetical protein
MQHSLVIPGRFEEANPESLPSEYHLWNPAPARCGVPE